MTRRSISILLLSLVTLWPGAARALLVTWELEGTIDAVAPTSIVIPYPLRPVTPNADAIVAQLEAIGVSPGAAWSASVTFDSDAPAEPLGAFDDAEFPGATKSIEFAVGGFAARTPDGAEGSASSFAASFDPYGGPPTTAYLVFRAPLAMNASGLFADSMFFSFVSGHPGGVYSTSLPTEPPDLADVTYVDVVLFGHGLFPNSEEAILEGGPAQIQQLFELHARVTSVTPVPEPSLGALLLAGAGVALALRRRF